MAANLEQSFEFCCQLTRREAKNFYFSFLTLSKEKRDSMCAIYAWMRSLDDLADDAASPQQARIAVEEWRRKTHTVLTGVESVTPNSSLWPAFTDTVMRYKVPHGYFDEIAEGALMDQEILRYETFEDLYRYCYRVASVVGLVCLHVFEYSDPQAEKNGEWLGIAFQLTNILRDVREDAERGRIYLPLQDLRKYGVTEKDVLEYRWTENFRECLEFFAKRAEGYYVQAKPLTQLISKKARPTIQIMTDIYHGILVELEKMDFRVFEKRARVSAWKKMGIVLKHQLTSQWK